MPETLLSARGSKRNILEIVVFVVMHLSMLSCWGGGGGGEAGHRQGI